MRIRRLRDAAPRPAAVVGATVLVSLAVVFTGGWSSPLFLAYYPAVALGASPRARRQLAQACFASAAYLLVLGATGWGAPTGELVLRLVVLFAAVGLAGARARELEESTMQHTWALAELEERATELKRLADEKEFLALHDPLTGLPNRMLFDDRLRQALALAERERTGAALLVADLDGFKNVNDTYGHHVGDAVLRQIGPRLSRDLRRVDTVARLGGDEFAVVLPGLVDASAARRIADELRAVVREPFVVGELVLDLDASVGVALFQVHGTDAETLLRRADYAMYAAKDKHSGVELATPGAGPAADAVA
ncbi:MAG: hypothetical protein QOE36_3456 [Gaiellaceae bacterium]|jgi:diguanylate cyclase (GGDEF)-like protein|nr:hypothetical protein [Gaiellaceae bacterium]